MFSFVILFVLTFSQEVGHHIIEDVRRSLVDEQLSIPLTMFPGDGECTTLPLDNPLSSGFYKFHCKEGENGVDEVEIQRFVENESSCNDDVAFTLTVESGDTTDGGVKITCVHQNGIVKVKLEESYFATVENIEIAHVGFWECEDNDSATENPCRIVTAPKSVFDEKFGLFETFDHGDAYFRNQIDTGSDGEGRRKLFGFVSRRRRRRRAPTPRPTTRMPTTALPTLSAFPTTSVPSAFPTTSEPSGSPTTSQPTSQPTNQPTYSCEYESVVADNTCSVEELIDETAAQSFTFENCKAKCSEDLECQYLFFGNTGNDQMVCQRYRSCNTVRSISGGETFQRICDDIPFVPTAHLLEEGQECTNSIDIPSDDETNPLEKCASLIYAAFVNGECSLEFEWRPGHCRCQRPQITCDLQTGLANRYRLKTEATILKENLNKNCLQSDGTLKPECNSFGTCTSNDFQKGGKVHKFYGLIKSQVANVVAFAVERACRAVTIVRQKCQRTCNVLTGWLGWLGKLICKVACFPVRFVELICDEVQKRWIDPMKREAELMIEQQREEIAKTCGLNVKAKESSSALTQTQRHCGDSELKSYLVAISQDEKTEYECVCKKSESGFGVELEFSFTAMFMQFAFTKGSAYGKNGVAVKYGGSSFGFDLEIVGGSIGISLLFIQNIPEMVSSKVLQFRVELPTPVVSLELGTMIGWKNLQRPSFVGIYGGMGAGMAGGLFRGLKNLITGKENPEGEDFLKNSEIKSATCKFGFPERRRLLTHNGEE